MRFAPILAALRADAGCGPLPRHRRGRAVRLRARRHRAARRAPSATCAGIAGRTGSAMAEAPRFAVREIALYERPVVLRLPFRFGVVTLTECPQAFARARIEFADGSERLGRRGRDDGAQVVRQEPGAQQRGQLRPAARRAAAGARGLPGRRDARDRLRPLRAAPRRAPRSRRGAGLQPAAGQLRPGAARPRGARCAVPRAAASRSTRRCAATCRASAPARPEFAGFDFDALPRRAGAGRAASRRATRSAWSMRSPRPT